MPKAAKAMENAPVKRKKGRKPKVQGAATQPGAPVSWPRRTSLADRCLRLSETDWTNVRRTFCVASQQEARSETIVEWLGRCNIFRLLKPSPLQCYRQPDLQLHRLKQNFGIKDATVARRRRLQATSGDCWAPSA